MRLTVQNPPHVKPHHHLLVHSGEQAGGAQHVNVAGFCNSISTILLKQRRHFFSFFPVSVIVCPVCVRCSRKSETNGFGEDMNITRRRNMEGMGLSNGG